MKFKLPSSLVALLLLPFGGCAITPAEGVDAPVALDGQAIRLEGDRYLQYRVGTHIQASPATVWALLTDGPAYPTWNSTVTRIEGEVALGETIELKAKIDPKRTFKLEIREMQENERLTWGDGGKAFSGVRTFTLSAREDGTTDFTMVETLQGTMMGMIAPKLPDFRPPFNDFAADLKVAAEAREGNGAGAGV